MSTTAINRPLPVLPPERPRYYGGEVSTVRVSPVTTLPVTPQPVVDRTVELTRALHENARNHPVVRPPYKPLPVIDPTL